jgi:outer membrane protein OmpA-like peptidoglycan-associated protein
MLLMAALFVACGQGAETPAVTNDAAAAQAAQAAAVPAATEEDFVPADAQQRAEAVLNAGFNRDKTTKLQMNITTLVGRTSSLEGFSTGLTAREEKIEDRLSRLNAKVTGTEVIIQLPGSILFDFDSAAIRPDAERALEDVRQVIASYAARPVKIEGHTDSVASDDYNVRLSQARASSVAKWLTDHGVEKSRLTATGAGESRPVASNDTSEGRQKNRRVEIVIATK